MWLPTTSHSDINPLTSINPEYSGQKYEESQTRRIDDHNKNQKEDDHIGEHHLTVTITRNDRSDLSIRLTSLLKEPGRQDRTEKLNLAFVQKSRNGLIEYSFEDDGEHNFVIAALPCAGYAMIKNIFHRHESHEEECDSVLKAYVSPNPVNIKAPDNKALEFYFEQFEKKFRANLAEMREEMYKLESAESSLPEDKFGFFNPKILDMFVKPSGENVYYNSLLNSWYNVYSDPCKTHVDYTHTGGLNMDRCKNLHRMAVNTRNYIDHIDILREKYREWLRYYDNVISISSFADIVRSMRQSSVIANISIIIGVASLFVSLLSCLLDKGKNIYLFGIWVGLISVIVGTICLLVAIISFNRSSFGFRLRGH